MILIVDLQLIVSSLTQIVSTIRDSRVEFFLQFRKFKP